MTTTQHAPEQSTDADLQPLLRQAHRTWRRAGVIPADRDRLADELHSEVIAATEAGQPASAVLGVDTTATLRDWAYGHQVAGRGLRLLILIPITLACVLLGSSVLVTTSIVTILVPEAPFITHGAIWVAIVINAAVVSWILAPLACWAALHHDGDPRAASTGRWLFALLPLGAGIALLIDIMIATASGTEGPFIQAMTIATIVAFAATCVLARYLATRYTATARHC